MSKLEFGLTAKDKITGFEGVIGAFARYISGCNQVLLIPKLDYQNNHRDSQWFDEQRIEIVSSVEKIVLDNGEKPRFGKPAPKI